jgi:hypothetical protein
MPYARMLNVVANVEKARQMRGNRYKKKGTLAEWEAQAKLEHDGYYTLRAAGSLGSFDIVGIPRRGSGHSMPLLVEVKCNRWPSGKQLQKYLDAAACVVGRCEVWVRFDGGLGGRPVRWAAKDLHNWTDKPMLEWIGKRYGTA